MFFYRSKNYLPFSYVKLLEIKIVTTAKNNSYYFIMNLLDKKYLSCSFYYFTKASNTFIKLAASSFLYLVSPRTSPFSFSTNTYGNICFLL